MPGEDSSRHPAPASPELCAYQTQFEALKQEARVLVNGMEADAFNWRPAPDRWSVGECLDHLNRTGALMVPRLERAIARGRSKGLTAEGPFTYGWLGRWWIRAMQPASRRKMTTPKVFRPSASALEPAPVVAAFEALQDDLMALVRAADGLDLRRVKAASAALPVLRLSLGVWFASTAAHEERHLAQARRVMAHAGFPHPEPADALAEL
ncbi:MAG: DinB family protein [Rhodothermales bacterium]|nr:DinB family protein [Rhodothermales bacterium]